MLLDARRFGTLIDVLKQTSHPVVAVFRALKIGDFFCATPALRALRTSLPGAHITLIGLAWQKELAQRYSSLFDEFVVFPGFPGLPEQSFDLARTMTFLANMQKRKFDLAIQMHGSGFYTNALVELFGARYTAGFRHPDQGERDHFLPYPFYGHEAERLQALSVSIGCERTPLNLEFPFTKDDYDGFARLDVVLHLTRKPFAVIHPGASDTRRQIDARFFAGVIERLYARGILSVVTGVAAERRIVQRIRSFTQVPFTDLTGKTTLGETGVILSRSIGLITNDTGLSHLAVALDVPSVVVADPTVSDLERWAPLNPSQHPVLTVEKLTVFSAIQTLFSLLGKPATEEAYA